MKKVLIISNIFPPIGGTGVQRNLKFVKYLPQFGWQSFVLTVKPSYLLLKDNDLLKEVPKKTKIYRTNCLKPKQKNLSWIKFNTAKRKNDNYFKNILNLVLKFIEKEIVIPDIWIGWLPFALFTGNKAIKQNKINVIFCSGPSFTSFIVGYILSKRSKLPLVLDYRDGWFFNTDEFALKYNTVKSFINIQIEKTVTKRASQVIFVSDEMLKKYCDKFKFIADKSIVITNGFDHKDFLNISDFKKKDDNKITISYVGSCDKNREPIASMFLEIIKNILDKKRESTSNLKVMFTGALPQKLEEVIKKNNLQNNVQKISFAPHREALALMKSSDILLLLIDSSPNNKVIFSGKLFEYFGAKKPIICLGPKDGAAGKAIKKYQRGIIIDYETEKKEEMTQKISSFIDQVSNDKFKINNDKFLKKYEREELTRQLSALLDRSMVKN